MESYLYGQCLSKLVYDSPVVQYDHSFLMSLLVVQLFYI
jgi:hypothetical protein